MIFSTIHPARAIDTPFGPDRDPLPAILTLDCPFDHFIMSADLVNPSNKKQS